MRFHLEDYPGEKIVMHFACLEEAEQFFTYLHKKGKKWRDGDSYIDFQLYEDYRGGLVSFFNEGTYGYFDTCIEAGFSILEFSDFDWGKKSNTTYEFSDLEIATVLKIE